jgi:hypothetical protein
MGPPHRLITPHGIPVDVRWPGEAALPADSDRKCPDKQFTVEPIILWPVIDLPPVLTVRRPLDKPLMNRLHNELVQPCSP